MARELQQGRFPATYRAASRSSRALRASQMLYVRKSKAKIHRGRRKKQRAECFVICRKARRHRFLIQKKSSCKKKYGTKNHERTNARTHIYLGFWCSNPKLGCLVQDGSWHRRLLTSTIPSSFKRVVGKRASQPGQWTMEAIVSKLRGGPGTWYKNWHHRS